VAQIGELPPQLRRVARHRQRIHETGRIATRLVRVVHKLFAVARFGAVAVFVVGRDQQLGNGFLERHRVGETTRPCGWRSGKCRGSAQRQRWCRRRRALRISNDAASQTDNATGLLLDLLQRRRMSDRNSRARCDMDSEGGQRRENSAIGIESEAMIEKTALNSTIGKDKQKQTRDCRSSQPRRAHTQAVRENVSPRERGGLRRHFI
jgi:hypothetical protein